MLLDKRSTEAPACMIGVVMALLGFGVIMVYSASGGRTTAMASADRFSFGVKAISPKCVLCKVVSS